MHISNLAIEDPKDGAPTRQVATEYVYVMEFDGDRIRHITKIWNDKFASRAAA